ncbi:hypothetical protein C8J57DRAFT_1668932, partial [Mycena rebaudengoi]
MQPSTSLKTLVQYITLAATTTKEFSDSAKIPFLATTAALALAIAKCVESVRSHKEDCIQMMENIHQILCAIVKLYSASEIEGALPTALLYDIAIFTETLQKVYTFLKAQQGMGKIKQLFKHSENATSLGTCKHELNHALEIFKVRASGSTISQMAQMRKDSKQQHEELLALLAAYPDLTNSDRSSVTQTLSSLGNSSESFSMLPLYPQIFYGRDSELGAIVNILIQDSVRVAIQGTGGMGKTSLATAALHHLDVVSKYSNRYSVLCPSAPTCAELVSAIADHLGIKGSGLSRRIVLHFTQALPSLLILDNFETPWEGNTLRAEVEEFLSLLADVLQMGLLITLRGAELPAKAKWNRPFLAPMEPLSSSATLGKRLLARIAEVGAEVGASSWGQVGQLLELTGNLPLAISLIASVAGHEGCKQALSRWKFESTRMVSDGYDKRSSLDISIMLSFTSSWMTAEAQGLLSILSMPPNGLTDRDLVQAKLHIANILGCKATLLCTSLAFIDKDHRLKVLVLIREYTLTIHAPTNAMKLALHQHFHNILQLWSSFHTLNSANIVSQVSQNLANLNSVLLDALNTKCSDAIQNFESIMLLNSFYRSTQDTGSPLFQNLSRKILAWKDQLIFGNT